MLYNTRHQSLTSADHDLLVTSPNFLIITNQMRELVTSFSSWKLAFWETHSQLTQFWGSNYKQARMQCDVTKATATDFLNLCTHMRPRHHCPSLQFIICSHGEVSTVLFKISITQIHIFILLASCCLFAFQVGSGTPELQISHLRPHC